MERKKAKQAVNVASFEYMNEYLKPYQQKGNQDNIYIGPYFSVSKGASAHMQPLLDTYAPIRINTTRIIIISEGWSEPVLNLHKYRLDVGDLLFVNYGAIVGRESIVPMLKFDGVVLTMEYLNNLYKGKLPNIFLKPGQNFKITLTQEERETYENYISTLKSLLRLPIKNTESINSMFVSLLNLTQALYEKNIVPSKETMPHRSRMVENFTRLVIENSRKEHELDFYASILCVTSHHLGIIVKKETGNTAKFWIDKVLITDMQVELKYSGLSLKTIAGEFNFPSLSSFCKFFKRKTGMTPSEFKNKKIALPEHEKNHTDFAK